MDETLLVGPSAQDEAKMRQNAAFRQIGVVVTLAGLLGFTPSLYKAIATGSLWSVSHDAPHTKNTFLVPHLLGMLVWMICLLIQFPTGGMVGLEKWHRSGGYIGLSGLLVGMVFATANELEYDSGGGLVYTLALVVGTTTNALLGIRQARAKNYPSHKDHMLMAAMFTLDPAIHRLAMWIIRGGTALLASRGQPIMLDPIVLLLLGKIPANLILFAVFGTMVVRGKRVNRVTVSNISFNAVSLVLLSVFAFTQTKASSSSSSSSSQQVVAPIVWVGVAAADAAFLVAVTALVVAHKAQQRREPQNPKLPPEAPSRMPRMPP